MSLLDRFKKHDQPADIAVTPDELAAARAANNLPQQEAEAARRRLLEDAAAAGRVVVHNSEVTGELPVTTPETPQDVDSHQAA